MNRIRTFNLRNLTAVYRWYLLPTYFIYSLEELKKALPYVDRTILTCTLTYVHVDIIPMYGGGTTGFRGTRPATRFKVVSRVSSSRCCCWSGGGKRRVQSVAVVRARRQKNSELAKTRRYSAGLAPNA